MKLPRVIKLNPSRLKLQGGVNKTTGLVFVIAFATIGSVLLFTTRAAGPFASVEPEQGIVTAVATTSVDATASGGQYVQFAGAPPSSSRCPAYPAFPDAACTGVPPGVTLRSCSGNLNTAGMVYDGCLFSSGINVSASNITVKNSKILGGPYASGSISGIKFIDVEVDGQNSDQDAFGYTFGNYTCTRCNVHHVSKGFSGSNFTIIDTYVHDLYGETSCAKYPSDCISHNEPVLGSGGNIEIRHSNLVGNFSSSSTGGGMSAVIALYTHGNCSGWCWGPLDNVLIQQNRLETKEAVYCMYGGYSTDEMPTNIRVVNNSFYVNPTTGTCGTGGPIVGWKQGGGNVWSGNVMLTSTGTTTSFPEPASSPY